MSTNPITTALDHLVELVSLAGVENVSRTPNTFFPNPVGVLIATPTIKSFGVATFTIDVDVYVVAAARPDADSLDAMFPVVLTVLDVLQTSEAQPTLWGGGPNVDPLPAYTLTATITTTP